MGEYTPLGGGVYSWYTGTGGLYRPLAWCGG